MYDILCIHVTSITINNLQALAHQHGNKYRTQISTKKANNSHLYNYLYFNGGLVNYLNYLFN